MVLVSGIHFYVFTAKRCLQQPGNPGTNNRLVKNANESAISKSRADIRLQLIYSPYRLCNRNALVQEPWHSGLACGLRCAIDGHPRSCRGFRLDRNHGCLDAKDHEERKGTRMTRARANGPAGSCGRKEADKPINIGKQEVESQKAREAAEPATDLHRSVASLLVPQSMLSNHRRILF